MARGERGTSGTHRWSRFATAAFLGLSAVAIPTAASAVQPPDAVIAAQAWVAPVNASIVSGFETASRPDHEGVDLGAARGTAIRAAASGTVIVRTCNASLNGQPYGCDSDGSAQVQGCGWYVDIRHDGGVVTRYCHLGAAPLVAVGDTVTAGQKIGHVGSSGNSSGPHLHFEVHLAGDGGYATNENAIDPIPFMITHGAPLGAGDDTPSPPHLGRADVDGDGRTDFAVWRPADGTWSTRLADGDQPAPVVLGQAGDVPLAGDYDGDGITDPGIWRPSTGVWSIHGSSGVDIEPFEFGTDWDVPVPGDYDGDRHTDAAIWRPYAGLFTIRFANGDPDVTVSLGEPGDVPAVGDYDGDGKDDPAVWRPTDGHWLVHPSGGGPAPDVALGRAGDTPVPGDYDGDGRTDYAVWRPSDGQWYVGTATPVAWGKDGDVPLVGDYDGDGRTDFAVWRPAAAQWLVLPSAGESTLDVTFGTAGDTPANGPQWIASPRVSLLELLIRTAARAGTPSLPVTPPRLPRQGGGQ